MKMKSLESGLIVPVNARSEKLKELGLPEDCRTTCAAPYHRGPGRKYDCIQVCENLVGLTFDRACYDYLSVFVPAHIRVTTGEETTDWMDRRITVVVSEEFKIKEIHMEVSYCYESSNFRVFLAKLAVG